MRGKVILILAGVCFILSIGLLFSCASKEPADAFKNPERPKVQELTPEQKFQLAIEPFKKMLETAKVVEETDQIDKPGVPKIIEIRKMLMDGTAPADIDMAAYGAAMMGPFADVNPSDIHPMFAAVLEGVAPGQPSKILWAEGLGFAVAYVVAKDEASGKVSVIVITVPGGATTTQTESGGTTTEMPTSEAPTG